jgi:uncharacterized protein YabN with tetrapyrrole methylase and pyrophosphatase domain
MGSLTIVGLGPARPEHVTLGAADCLREGAARGARAYGLSHAAALARAIAPGLEVRALDWLYAVPGLSRPAAYQDLARMLLRRAFDDGFDVLYLVAGSPYVINDTVFMLRRAAPERVRVIPGMSFLDLVLDGVHWSGHRGLQIYSAWNLAMDGVTLDPGAPALLVQLGEHGPGGDAVDADGSPAMLAALRDTLLRTYPPDHGVTVLSSSGPPEYRSEARTIPLAHLSDRPVPVYANLWVPER